MDEYEFFKPKSTNQYNFAIKFTISPHKENCLVKIHEAPIDEDLKTGDKIDLIHPPLFFEIDVWRKYYFPKMHSENLQWYHKEDFNDEIQAMAEVMEYCSQKAVNMIGGAL